MHFNNNNNKKKYKIKTVFLSVHPIVHIVFGMKYNNLRSHICQHLSISNNKSNVVIYLNNNSLFAVKLFKSQVEFFKCSVHWYIYGQDSMILEFLTLVKVKRSCTF